MQTSARRRGWFRIDGVQEGDRTLEEQLLGLQPALEEAQNKTVLDLGCAEGLIAREFARAGAAYVHGLEVHRPFVETAQELLKDYSAGVDHCDLDGPFAWPRHLDGERWDVVLCLAILHKLGGPAHLLRRIADAGTPLIVIRLPIGSSGTFARKGWPDQICRSVDVLNKLGYQLESDLSGPRGERVHYWRRR